MGSSSLRIGVEKNMSFHHPEQVWGTHHEPTRFHSLKSSSKAKGCDFIPLSKYCLDQLLRYKRGPKSLRSGNAKLDGEENGSWTAKLPEFLSQKNGVGKKIGEKGAPTVVRIYIYIIIYIYILGPRGCNWGKTQIEMTRMLWLKAMFFTGEAWQARFKMRIYINSIVNSHGTW